ncbi:MAG: DNA glycosylase, partial [Candidatus Methanoperedens sp.]|nr:DNA glycosylase [Candidatus Methanoperedens sp.]
MYRIKINDFNLDHSLSCGQVFRWEKKGWWKGIIKGAFVRVKQEDRELMIESSLDKDQIIDYFRLDDDLEEIYAFISRDEKIIS